MAKLGEGGMGQVYRARDRKLDRDVALKVLPEGFAADADRLMRFTREAKTLAALNHPHIAQVYDAGRLRPEGASAGQGREGASAGQGREGASAGQGREGASAGQGREGASAGQGREGASAGQGREGASAGQGREGASAGQGREGASADQGREGSVAYIAMEFVDGEDLAGRIGRGAVPIPEALPIARQIADALAAAHDAGIVHRDLKPANIKVRDDGTVKVLDFGLAKGATGEMSSSGDSGATMTSPAMTAMGLILGTASYMSPEQAKGKPVDRRADVWAFGVVLYEMLTGTFLFGREDITDTLAAVLTYEPDLTKLPASTPPAIRRLLQHCLVKDKRQRLDSMAAARIEIDDVLGGKVGEAVAVAPAAPASGAWLPAAAFVVGGVAMGVLASVWWPRASPAPASPSSVVARIPAPRDAISAFHEGFALAADGSKLTFAARNTSGVRQIWVRRLDADTAHPIPGTEGALYPFWSPDGANIGFFADGKLRRVGEDGARLQTICDAPGADGPGSWNQRDEILFEASSGGQQKVWKVAAGGGTPTPFDALGPAVGPVWLTDGQRFLFAAESKTGQVELRLSSVDGQGSQSVAPLARGTAEFAYGGELLFLNKNDTLTAQRLDSSTGTLVGSPVPLAHIAGNPKDWFSVSSNGDRVVALVRESPADIGDPGDPMARLIWVDRRGAPAVPLATPAATGPCGSRRMAPAPSSIQGMTSGCFGRTAVTFG